jgi:hypothetical protein
MKPTEKRERGRPKSVFLEDSGRTISFRIPESSFDELIELIDTEQVTLSGLMRVMIQGYLEDRRRERAASAAARRRARSSEPLGSH